MYSDYLIKGEAARVLYRDYAATLPVIDYHNHLSAQQISENKPFGGITEFWLEGDHYKWRAMRAAGVDEKFITGDAGDFEKFSAWIDTVSRLVGSPLYTWCRMELEQLFGIELAPVKENAAAIYEACNRLLTAAEYTPKTILQKFGVKAACIISDPFETLEYHSSFTSNEMSLRPIFRPDKLMPVGTPGWLAAVKQLEASEGCEINSLDSLKAALEHSLGRFIALGCPTADHGFEVFSYIQPQEDAVAETVKKALAGGKVAQAEAVAFVSYIMTWLGEEYQRRGLVMQLHIGALRNQNTRLFDALGPDAGGDCTGNTTDVRQLATFLDALDAKGQLPKTILFSLNCGDWPQLAALSATFTQAGIRCKVQPGAAWWMNDTEQGITNLFYELANHGLIHGFVGMLTDSRSLGSFVRHDYFRRLLCSWMGDQVDSGSYPDLQAAGRLVQDICLGNAEGFFDIK